LSRRAAVLLAGAVAALALLAAVGHEAAALLPRFAAWVESLGTLGIAAFIVGYAAAAVLLVPGSLLTLAAGAVFGLAKGVAIVFVAATLGACAAFLIARYAARGAIERRLADGGAAPHPEPGVGAATEADGPATGAAHGARPARGFGALIAAIDEAAGRRGLLVVLLLRLSPIVPFSVLNYLLGLSRVRFTDYAIASVGMLPGTLLYVYYGRVAGDIAAVAAGVAPPRGAEYWALLAVGLAATIAVTVVLGRMARRVLRERVGGVDAPDATSESGGPS
jgi:uncharacterized membrane protein YdjX (TVP38/TMEM64 family)